MLNELSGIVENYLKKSISTIICTNLADFIAINGTNFIVNNMDPFLERLVLSKSDIVPIDVDSNVDFIHWDHSIISSMLMMIDKFMNSNFLMCIEQSYPHLQEILAKPVVDYVIDVSSNGTGIINIIVNDTLTLLDGNYSLSVSSMSLSGFDTFTKVSLLEPSLSSNISLNTMIQFDELEVVVYSAFQSTNSNLYLHDYKELLEFKMKLSNITMSLDMAVGIVKKDFSNLFIDQLFNLDCWLTTGLKYLNITSLVFDVDINDISIVQVSGNAAVLEKDLLSLLNNVNILLNTGYGELITATIAGIAQGPLRNHLNNLISIRQSAATCPQHVEPSTADIIEWSESKFVSATVIEANTMNTIVDCATNKTGRALFSFGHWNLSIANLDSFYEFESLFPYNDPAKSYDIGSTISVGQCRSGKCKPLAFSLNKDQALLSSQQPSLSSMETLLSSFTMVSMKLSNLSLNFDTTVKFDMSAFKNLQVYQLDVNGCVASSMEMIKINSMSVKAADISTTFTIDGKTITKNVTTMTSSLISPSIDTFSLTDLVNSCIENSLSSSSATCANDGVPIVDDDDNDDDIDSSSSQNMVTIIAAAAGGILVLSTLIMFYRKKTSLRKSRDSNTSFVTTWDFSESLINQTHTSFFLRMTLLLLIFGNIALFVISNSDLKAVAVLLEVDSTNNGKTITLIPPTAVFYFDLVHTVRDMWRAKAYILASLIAFFTGFWPYFKLFFMLAAFTLPSSIISIDKRDSRLKLLGIT